MKPMELPLFRKIIDEAASMGVPEVVLNGYGELLTLQNLEDYLKYIRSKKHRFFITINTNGHRMDFSKRKLFFNYKVDMINICLDGAKHSTIAAIRRNLDPARTERNVLDLLEEKKTTKGFAPKVRLGLVKIAINAHETEEYLEKWNNKADIVGVDCSSNRGGSVDEDLVKGTAMGSSTCALPFHTLNVWSNGQCVICCNDWNAELTVGNLETQSIHDAWSSKAFMLIRRAHSAGRGDIISICAKCNFWNEPKPGQRLWS
jgi:MoaA/NifB/PqqE/SkfB family radical SAM enzyme